VIRRHLQFVRCERGFTLIELLVAMILMGLLAALFSTVISSAVQHGGEVEAKSVLQAEVRASVERLAQDLRQAYSGQDGVSPIESMSASAVQFLSPDRAEPFHLRRIGYQATGSQFQRRFATSTDTDGAPWVWPALGGWATEVRSLASTSVFTYLDANGVATASPAAVETVVIRVVVRPYESRGRQYVYETSVTLRADQG
jgi:prepilin-type N-terminal cleavage/methylation domain-containing protein